MDSYKLRQIFRHVCMIHIDINRGYMMAMLFYEVSLQSPWFSGILSSNGATLELEKLMVSSFTLHYRQHLDTEMITINQTHQFFGWTWCKPPLGSELQISYIICIQILLDFE